MPPREHDGPHPFKVTIVRYVGPDGRRCASSTPGARKVRKKSKRYYASIPLEGGGHKRVALGTSNIGEAWERLRRRLREGEPDSLPARQRRPILEHAAEWVAALRETRRRTPDGITLLDWRIRKLIEVAGWKRLTDVTEDGARAALEVLRAEDYRGSQGPTRGQRTLNDYARQLRQFLRWCVQGGRLASDPLARLRLPSPEADLRHLRRPPTDAEVAALMAQLYSPHARTRRGLSPKLRALGYKVCMATGYRAGELRRIERAGIDLDAGTVAVAAAYSKNRRLSVQPIPAWLRDELRAWLDAGGELWGRWPAKQPGKVLQADLLAASVLYVTPGPNGPLYLDMHSFRVWYITRLASDPAIDVKTLMELARHSDPRLTLQIYARAQTERTRAAVDRLPSLPGAQPPAPPPEG